MNFFRVGAVDFFGILCPGVLLLVNLQLFLAVAGNRQLPAEMTFGDVSEVFRGLLVFVLSYLCGFVLRMVSPDYLDRFATLFTWLRRPDLFMARSRFRRRVRRRLEPTPVTKSRIDNECRREYEALIRTGERLPGFFWHEDRYPYYLSTKAAYWMYMPSLAAEAMSERQYHSRSAYNFWKVWLAQNAPDLATLVFQAEAQVRFVAGSCFALALGVISGALFAAVREISFGGAWATGSAIAASVILIGFKNQRRREVKLLLDCIEVASGAGLPNSRVERRVSSA
jgi:hypothetical protein